MNGRNFLPNGDNNQMPESWKNSFFGGHHKSANDYIDEIPGTVKPYLDPYIGAGGDAYNKMHPVYDQMTSDPVAFLEAIMKGYAPSRGFQLQKDQMLKAAGNSAAAGGVRGNISDIGNEARISDMLMGKDMQDWLGNILGIQKSGLEGESHLYDTGFDASKSLSDSLANALGTRATLKFQQDREDKKANSDFLSGLGGLAGGALGLYFGGPEGGMAGSKIGSNVGGFF